VRRPSAALVVALIALFVALGGPAYAARLINGADIKKGTVRSKQIKDRTIAVADISKTALKTLEATPNGSVSSIKLADGAVTNGKLDNGAVTGSKLAASSVGPVQLADGTVGTGKLAPNAVTGAQIADGSLTTADIARFAGRFRITAPDLGTIAPATCWSGEPQGLAPEQAGADISQDALLVTPLGSGLDERSLSVTARTSGSSEPSRFVIALCNVTTAPVTPPANGIAFSYVVLDVP
jgi:hypothetical protein